MKKILFFFSLLLIVCTQVQALTFSSGRENVVHQIASAVLLKAYKKIGIEPEFIYLSLQKSLDMSNAGKTDGEIARIKKITEQYPNLVRVPVVINFVEGIAYSKNSSLKITSWDDLRPYSIAIAKGAKFIETGTEGMNRVMVEGFVEAFELLEQDKVDIVVAPKTSGLYIVRKKRFHDISAVGSVLQKLDLYHFVHKKNADIVPKLTPVLESMKESGEISYIRSTYLNRLLGL